MIFLPQLSKMIYRARKERGLKQEALGHQVGCSGSYITKIERGQAVPSPVMASKLEEALGLKGGALSKAVNDIRTREEAFKREAVHKARFGPGNGNGRAKGR